MGGRGGLVRLTRAELPPGLNWPAIAGVAPLKGIGFTVAIFIATLAFADPELVAQAKVAILLASVLAGTLGVAALYLLHRTAPSEPDRWPASQPR